MKNKAGFAFVVGFLLAAVYAVAQPIVVGGSGNPIAPTSVSTTYIDAGIVKANVIDAGVINAQGPIRAAGDIESLGGRLWSRNASGGISLGVSGTQYWGMAAGSNALTSAFAILNLANQSTFQSNGQTLAYTQAPTVSSGFGTSPSITTGTGTFAFSVNVGTGGSASSGVIALGATANNGWSCKCDDVTTKSATVFVTKQTATSTTTCTVGNYNTSGAAAAWAASDILVCQAMAY